MSHVTRHNDTKNSENTPEATAPTYPETTMAKTGQTVRIRPDEWEKLEKAAVKLTIKKQRIVKTSDIVHRLINDYLEDCIDIMQKEKE